MSLADIRYEPLEANLVLEAYGPLLTEGDGLFRAPIAVVERLTLTEVRHALQAWATDHAADDPHIDVSLDAPEHFGEHSTVLASDVGLRAGELVVRARGFLESEPPDRRDLAAPLAPLLARCRARLVAIDIDEMPGYWMVTASIQWRRPGATIAQALELADDAGRLLGVGAGQEVDRAAVGDVVRAGRASILVGMRESEWLEAKSAPYRMGDTAQQIELAKDVAAMANAAGGLILIGVSTKRIGEFDEIRKINECRLGDVSPRRYRDLVRRRVYPPVEGFRVELIPGSTQEVGVALVSVPEQDAGQKPFLVHGAIIESGVLGAFVSVPRRVGDSTTAVDPQTLHARLRAGERALAAHGDPALRDVRNDLEQIRDDSVPAWLRRIVLAAREDGIDVRHARGSVTFSSPGRPSVVVSTEEGGPLMDELNRQRLVEQLAVLGLRTRRGPRGHLIPVSAA